MNAACFVLFLFSVFSPQNGTPQGLPASDKRLDVPITYDTKAKLASTILDDWSKSAKVSLSVDDPLDVEPLIIRLHNVPLREAMERIAHTLYGSWKEKDQSYMLIRPPEVEEQLEQAAIYKEAKRIRAMIAEALKTRPVKPLTYESVKRFYGTTSIVDGKALIQSTDQEQQDLRDNDYEARLQAAVLSILNPEKIADADYPAKIVFSDQPRPFEEKLDATDEQIRALYDEQNQWTTYERQFAQSDKGFEWLANDRHMIRPDDARLVILVSYDGNYLMARIHIVNGKGKEYFYESDATAYKEDPDEDASKSPELATFKKLGFHPAPISPEAMEIRSLLLSSDQDPKEGRPIEPAVKALVLDPVNHDPLSFAPSEVLLAMGDEKDWNVVARLNDDCVQKTGAVTGDKSDPAAFLANRAIDCDVTAADGWITIRPKEPLDEELSRADRPALAAFVNSIDKLGYPCIDAQAAYVAAHLKDGGVTLGYWWPLLLQYRGDPFDRENKNALRLYGLLSPSQKSLLLSGNTMPLDQLSKDELDAAKDWVLDEQEQGVDDSDESYAAQARSVTLDASNSEKGTGASDLIYWEPFDELLDNLNQMFGDGTILSMSRLDGTSIKEKTASGYEMWTTPQNTALSVPDPSHLSQYTFSLGKKHGVLMRIALSDRARIHTELTDHYGAMSAWMSYKNLPADLRKIIEDQAKRNNPYSFDAVSPQPAASGGDDGQGAPPPPPR